MRRSSNDLPANPRKSSLLMTGGMQRFFGAVAVIAMLWLAVGWAVRDAV